MRSTELYTVKRPPGRLPSPKRHTFEPYPCEQCGTLFGVWSASKRRFCSRTCSNTAVASGKRAVVLKTCGGCGVQFMAKPAEKYCAAACKQAAKKAAQNNIDTHRQEFVAHAKAFHLSVEHAIAAIDAKNTAALVKAGGEIDQACEGCHLQFWYPPNFKHKLVANP